MIWKSKTSTEAKFPFINNKGNDVCNNVPTFAEDIVHLRVCFKDQLETRKENLLFIW